MTTRPSILIIEDDDGLARLLLEYLEPHGFALERVASGSEGVQRILSDWPDLVVLDLMLPGANGLDVCRQVRDRYSGAILMLTASRSDADHVSGLELGADDFVNKPIEPRVLLARIRALLRRRQNAPQADTTASKLLDVGPLTIDSATRDVMVDGRSVELTSMEFDVLWHLADEAGTVVTREELYRRVLGSSWDGLDRGMDVHVSRIRKKLSRQGFDAARLKSVRGAGYLLAYR